MVALLFLVGHVSLPAAERIRLLIETDAGGDPDDEQSLVRFLLYANEWDLEGIIANREAAREGENLSPERTGFGIVRALVRAYGQCWSNLVQHDARYPDPARLLQRTVPGHDTTAEGVELILRTVDAPDPRPLWYSDWGSDRSSGTNNLRRALDRVRRERGPAGYQKFKDRLRLVSYDQFAEHTAAPPAWKLWVNTWQPEIKGRRWYHRFSALTATAGGFDVRRDVLTNHGPLGALYPLNTTHPQKEGDTTSFLYLVPTGMNDPLEPTWGSWAGRYGGKPDEFPARRYYWANQEDAWGGATNRDQTLRRWAVALQNDFRARLDWCVQPAKQANHPPRPMLNAVPGLDILRLWARPGTTLRVTAEGSGDPDGDALDLTWFVYPEAGTYQGPIELSALQGVASEIRLPDAAAGKQVHLVLEATDHGNPALVRYRRAVIEVGPAESAWSRISPLFRPAPEWQDQLGSYRSVLSFADGSRVTSAEQWPRRRQEIQASWQQLLGEWPKPIEKPVWEVVSDTRRDGFRQQRVRFAISPGQMHEGWLLVPDVPGPKPAVLVPYYEPETSIGLNSEQPHRDFAVQLTRRGFVTLSIGTPGGNAYRPDRGTVPCQPLSYYAYGAANCWHLLAALPDVDPRRIGVTGHSYGGKWALFAGAFFERFAAVAVSDPGMAFDEARPSVNYWEPWYLGLDPQVQRPRPGLITPDNPRTGAYRRLRERGHDLHELVALIAPRPFFVSGGSEDSPERWRVLNHGIQVNRLLGRSERVGMSNRPDHTPNEASNAQLYAFFEHFLGGASDALRRGE